MTVENLTAQLRAEAVLRRGARTGRGPGDDDGADEIADDIASIRFSSRRGGQHYIAMSSARGVGIASLSTDMVELRASMLRDAPALGTQRVSVAPTGVACDLSVWLLEIPGPVVGRGARASDDVDNDCE